ncbi:MULTISPECIES: hypothetical protein [Halobacillus]|nr:MULTISPECIES: hypothetical protein [Halobacillus]
MKEIEAVQKARSFLDRRISGNDQTIELLFTTVMAGGKKRRYSR